MQLTDSQIKQFALEEINGRNFLLYSKLLNLTDQTNYRRIIEMLYSRQINYFMLADLPIIDDESVRLFLASYDIQSSPELLFHAPATGTFRPIDYLYGKLTNVTHPYVSDLMAQYNVSENRDYTAARVYTDFSRPRAIISGRNAEAYATSQALTANFNSAVLTPLLSHFGVQDVRELFPLPEAFAVGSAFVSSVRNKYESAIPFLPLLNNAGAMKLLLTVGDDLSEVEKMSVESNELYNFQKYAKNLPTMHRHHMFELASLQRVYSASEMTALEGQIHDAVFSGIKLSESFSRIRYLCALVELDKAYAGFAGYFTLYISDLDAIVARIGVFKDFIDVALKLMNDNLKLTNKRG